MRTSTNQGIWGRRGTGKTHLLKAFTQKVNEDYGAADISFYFSSDKAIIDIPSSEKVFYDDKSKIKYIAREAFKAFMLEFCACMIDDFEEILMLKTDAISSEINYERQIAIINQKIYQLMNSVTKDNYKEETSTISEKVKINENCLNEKGHEMNLGLDAVALSGKMGFSTSKKNICKIEKEIEKQITYELQSDIYYIKKSFAELLETIPFSCIYLCIDEFWLLDMKDATSFQPYFLEDIRQVFNCHNKVSIKIASIRETTVLNSKSSAEKLFGMQNGDDIMELAHLDPIQTKDNVIYNKFIDILERRINYFTKEKNTEYPRDFIIRAIFKEKRYLEKLITYSHGVPRNFLNILNICLQNIDYNLENMYVSTEVISEIVMTKYKIDYRANIPLDHVLFKNIKAYTIDTNNYYFMVTNRMQKKYENEINLLLFNHLIHRIPSDQTPLSIMDNYKTYYLDAGMYLFIQKELNIDAYKRLLESFELQIPNDLEENKEKYTLLFT